MKAAKIIGLHDQSDKESFFAGIKPVYSERIRPISQNSIWHSTHPHQVPLVHSVAYGEAGL